VDVGDIWGIGQRHAARLKKQRIHTALELKNCADTWIRKQLTVTGLRTVMELRGIPCISLEKAVPAKQSICTSRSFGQPVHALADLQEAVATYAAQAAYKLRSGGLRATVVDVFIRTNSFKKDEPQYCNRRTLTLPTPSSHTATLIKTALASLKAIYRPGYYYQKAGVLLNDLVPESHNQLHLFHTPGPGDISLMNAVDKINKRWGRNTIQFAAAGLAKKWHFKQMKKSPAYTTCWAELPTVKASFPERFSMA
jgi:DNA polymerase V